MDRDSGASSCAAVLQSLIQASQRGLHSGAFLEESIVRLKQDIHCEIFTSPWCHEQLYVRLAEALYQLGSGPDFKGREDGSYAEEDFPDVADSAARIMEIFDIIFTNINLENEEMISVLNKIVLSLSTRAMVIIVEHHEQQLWSNEASVEHSHALLRRIMDVCNCKSLSELLCGGESLHFIPDGLFQCVASVLKPRVSQAHWKQNPSAMIAWQWCIMHTKWPFVSDNLHVMLPAALCLTDDFQTENKIRGIQCLAHILEHATAGAVQCYGRGEIIYQALQHQLYVRDVRLQEALLPALVACLLILEGSSWCVQCPEKENRYDEILERLLRDMELESVIIIRRTCATHLPALLAPMGIAVTRHIPTLLRVCEDYLSVYDGPHEQCRLLTLQVLECVIRQCWPRMAHHSQQVTNMLLKLIYDATMDRTLTPPEVNSALVTRANECLLWLSHSTGDVVTLQLKEALGCDLPTDLLQRYRDVLLTISDQSLQGGLDKS